jgi:ornithine cyclodeaminase/alanine dehydrogenase-like protein (mu-crystallin family)
MKKDLPPILYLSEEDVKLVIESSGLTFKNFIEIIEEEFKAISAGDFQLHPHDKLVDMTPALKEEFPEIPPQTSVCLPILSYYGPAKMAAVKWVTYSSERVKRGLPFQGHLLILTDAFLCAPVAIIQGLFLTGIRTSCVTAIGAKYGAKRNSNVVSLIGAGYQGGFQLLALNEILKIEEIRVYDISEEARERTAEGIGKKIGKRVIPCDNLEKALKDADVVVTATTARQPIIKYEWVEKASFLCNFSHDQNFEDRIVKSVNKIFVDYRKNYEHYHGQDVGSMIARKLMSTSDIYADLSELVTGIKKGRESDEEKILLNHGGMGTHDIAVGSIIYKLAKEKGIGTWCKSKIPPFAWK